MGWIKEERGREGFNDGENGENPKTERATQGPTSQKSSAAQIGLMTIKLYSLKIHLGTFSTGFSYKKGPPTQWEEPDFPSEIQIHTPLFAI